MRQFFKKQLKKGALPDFCRKMSLPGNGFLKLKRRFRRKQPIREKMRKRPERLALRRSGQGLIEYLILVALMGVATIGVIRTLNQTVKSRFANAIYALQGKKQKAKTHQLKKEDYQRSDLSNFMSGAASSDDKKRGRKKR